MMPKRKTDPETGEPSLNYRESKMVDQFVANGGNAARAAVDAGYSPKNPSQSAWNVLSRPNVQERTRARVSQAEINRDEAMGSLASQMRADVTDCFGPDGAFSVDLARQNGLGHLLKVSTTIHRKSDDSGFLRTTGDDTRIEFLSPQTAALQLARITAVSRPSPAQATSSDQSNGDERLDMLERTVALTMGEFPDMSREEVYEAILDVRPQAAQLIDQLRERQADPDG